MTWQAEAAIRHAQESMRLDSKLLGEADLHHPPPFPEPPQAREITYHYVDVFLIVSGSIAIGAFLTGVIFYLSSGILGCS